MEMKLNQSEAYHRSSNVRYVRGSSVTHICQSAVHFVAVDMKSTTTSVDQPFSVLKCVRLAWISEKYYELLCKKITAVPERTKNEL